MRGSLTCDTSLLAPCSYRPAGIFRVVPVRFGYGLEWFGSSGSCFWFRWFRWREESFFLCFRTVQQKGKFQENGSGGSGVGSWENGSDGSGFRFPFGSCAKKIIFLQELMCDTLISRAAQHPCNTTKTSRNKTQRSALGATQVLYCLGH